MVLGRSRLPFPMLRGISPHSPSRRLLLAERTALDVVRRVSKMAECSAQVQAVLAKNRIQLCKDIPYLGSGHRAHTLDVYRPRLADHNATLPVVMYVHGGGFEVGSKETHWMMASAFAKAGYLVVSINYRLAPKYPFPSGLSDVCAAYLWTLDNAARFGGDHKNIVVAGESAGGNLVTSLAIATCSERPESFAGAVYRRNRPPAAVFAACGFFEVSNASRYRQLADQSWFVTRQAIEQVARAYLPAAPIHAGEHDLADPLRLLESSARLCRPLPPFLVTCGTGDPLLHDSQRLEEALRTRRVELRAHYYPDEIHAFHAMWWRSASKTMWRDAWAFLTPTLENRMNEFSFVAA